MSNLRTTLDGERVEIVNTAIIEDEITDAKKYCVLIIKPNEDDEHWIDGDIHFEARFGDQNDADNFCELLKKAEVLDTA